MPRFDFINQQGATLAGRLELPETHPIAFAIFAHCFTCSKNAKAASQIAKQLAARGIAILRFDFTGLGNSEGDFANSNYSSNITDLIAAAETLRRQHQAPSLLVGHSLGGAAVLSAAALISEVKAVATIGAPSEPSHVTHLFGDQVARIEKDGSAKVVIGGREITIARQFLEDLQSNRLAETLPTLKKPLVIFHSPIDTVVSIDNARKLYEAARHPKCFVSLDGADHLLTSTADAEFVAAMLAAWAPRYLSASPQPTEQSRDLVPAGTVLVREMNGGLTQQVRTTHHEFFADEPVAHGGKDRGPNPYELLLASLGTCTSLTLRMYANRKDWDLQSITISLQHSRVHANDCVSCESQDGYIDRIEKSIQVSGQLDESQVARLTEIADRCPVHRTLVNEKEILTDLKHYDVLT